MEINMSNKIFLSVVIAVILISSCALASATPIFFDVAIGQTVSKTVALNQNDVCTGAIIVTGGTVSDLIVRVYSPDGNYVAVYSQVIYQAINFTAKSTGTYIFEFDNTAGTTSKNVDLNVDVKAGGISILPRGTILDPLVLIVIIAVIVAVVVILVLVLVSKRRKKAALKPELSEPAPPAPQAST
jgi:hypothetical protein